MGKMTALDVIDGLRGKHRSWICVEELRLSSGFGNEGRIDLWCINPAPSSGCRATAYEVKVSRGDFRRDSAFKQRGARLFADEFYYATPPGLVTKDEIPDWAGLVEVHSGGPIPDHMHQRYGGRTHYWPEVRTIVQAPKMDKHAPSWGLVVSLLRKQPICANDNAPAAESAA